MMIIRYTDATANVIYLPGDLDLLGVFDGVFLAAINSMVSLGTFKLALNELEVDNLFLDVFAELK